jgi:hypothetical protein
MKRNEMPVQGVVLATCEEIDKLYDYNPVPSEPITMNARPKPGGPPVGVYVNWADHWIFDGLAEIRGTDAEFELAEGAEVDWEMPKYLWPRR